MKTFATSAYIAPILEEIRTNYKPENSPATLAALDCVALLHKIGSRDYMAIRTPEKGGFYYHSKATKVLFADIEAWKEAAETEPGELDGWMYAEERRAMEEVRAALIDEYRKPRKTA
jgi:hypothetical protein